MSPDPTPERKIIVDEDWKSQVEAERETLRQQESSTDPGAAETSPRTDEQELPPASFEVLVNQLAISAMVALGQLKESEEAQPVIHLGMAKYHIDMLEMLQEKTKGNLTPPESRMVDDVLYQLRMIFVQVGNALHSQLSGQQPRG